MKSDKKIPFFTVLACLLCTVAVVSCTQVQQLTGTTWTGTAAGTSISYELKFTSDTEYTLTSSKTTTTEVGTYEFTDTKVTLTPSDGSDVKQATLDDTTLTFSGFVLTKE